MSVCAMQKKNSRKEKIKTNFTKLLKIQERLQVKQGDGMQCLNELDE